LGLGHGWRRTGHLGRPASAAGPGALEISSGPCRKLTYIYIRGCITCIYISRKWRDAPALRLYLLPLGLKPNNTTCTKGSLPINGSGWDTPGLRGRAPAGPPVCQPMGEGALRTCHRWRARSGRGRCCCAARRRRPARQRAHFRGLIKAWACTSPRACAVTR